MLKFMRVLFLFILFVGEASACTGILLKAKDGSVAYARTLEYGVGEIPFNIIVVPRNTDYQGTTPSGKDGIKWKTKYGFVGANFFDYNDIADGVNEKGLSVGLFLFPEYATFQPYSPKDKSQSLSSWELGTWILSQFATVEEVKKHIDSVRVVPVELKQLGEILPVHYMIHDKAGNSLVLEYVDGKLKTYENQLGVITNSPTYDWHITNLRNYINLRAFNQLPIDLAGNELNGFGQGDGMMGMPGDFTPPSRFVRATALTTTHVPAKDANEAIFYSFHILNSFDIPVGSVRGKQNGKTTYDHTQFTAASDLSNRKYFIRAYGDFQIRSISLDEFDLDKPGIKWIKMVTKDKIKDISDQAVPI